MHLCIIDSGVEPVWVDGSWLCQFIQSGYLISTQLQGSCAQIIMELAHFARSYQDGCDVRARKQPGQCDLRRRSVMLRANFSQFLYNSVAMFAVKRENVKACQSASISCGILACIFPCKKTTGKRTPNHDTYACILRKRGYFIFQVAPHQ